MANINIVIVYAGDGVGHDDDDDDDDGDGAAAAAAAAVGGGGGGTVMATVHMLLTVIVVVLTAETTAETIRNGAMDIQIGSSNVGVNSNLTNLSHIFQSSFAPISLTRFAASNEFSQKCMLPGQEMQIGRTFAENYSWFVVQLYFLTCQISSNTCIKQ